MGGMGVGRGVSYSNKVTKSTHGINNVDSQQSFSGANGEKGARARFTFGQKKEQSSRSVIGCNGYFSMCTIAINLALQRFFRMMNCTHSECLCAFSRLCLVAMHLDRFE